MPVGAASSYNLATVRGTRDAEEVGAASLHILSGTLVNRTFACRDCVEEGNLYSEGGLAILIE